MVPNVAKAGTSFKGAGLYYLHDKRESWEGERMTSDRVAWTATRNLATKDPDLAIRIMAATALDQDRLKAEAGVKNTGRKSAASVYVYSLAWHPDEGKTLSKGEMLRAADETLIALGAQGRQALIVCHRDEKHPHVHVIVNRVSPEDGRMLGTSNDRVKLSQWAEAYERQRGHIWCEARVANNARRAQGDFVRAASPTPRSMEKDFDRARGANDHEAKKARAEAKARMADLAGSSQAMNKRHRTEWDVLSKQHKDRKAGIYARSKANGDQLRASIKEQYRPDWRVLFREQSNELRAFKEREQRVIGKLANVAEALKTKNITEGDQRSYLAAGFNFLTSSKAREAALLKRQEIERKALATRQGKETTHAMTQERDRRGRLLKSAGAAFQTERAALIVRQGDERGQMRERWRVEGDRRGRSFEAASRSAKASRSAQEQRSGHEAADMASRREAFDQATNKASQTRKAGRSRSRSRKRS